MVERQRKFEQTVLPHLDSAYNLARWLTRNDHDAQDVVQEAVLRAYRFFDGLRGGEARPWLLAIVRNTCFTWIKANRPAEIIDGPELGNELSGLYDQEDRAATNPETLASINMNKRTLNEAIAALPAVYREVLILRELEDLAYKDISRIAGVPIGTVMSRLSRARRLLQQSLQVIASASAQRVQK